MAEWNYGDAYLRFPVEMDKPIDCGNGSTLMAHDIMDNLPKFMLRADIIFTDSPWNLGNMKSFYTKAGRETPSMDFFAFYTRLFQLIGDVKPRECYLEIGKEYLDEYIRNMRRIYKYVTFYNSSYYHKPTNFCYIVQGTNKRINRHWDNIDEEDIIDEIGKLDYDVLGDFCMGRGLVACAAKRNGKSFVGTELNPKRLAVCLERLSKIE